MIAVTQDAQRLVVPFDTLPKGQLFFLLLVHGGGHQDAIFSPPCPFDNPKLTRTAWLDFFVLVLDLIFDRSTGNGIEDEDENEDEDEPASTITSRVSLLTPFPRPT